MKFEYTVLDISEDEWNNSAKLAQRLNKLGSEGWELATSVSQQGLGKTAYSLVGMVNKAVLIFKRVAAE